MYNMAISRTALAINQFAIDTITNNIANANSPGFHRREVMLGANSDYFRNGRLVGGGVDVLNVRGMRNLVIEHSLSRAIGDTQSMSQRLAVESQIESLFLAGPGSLYDQYSTFYTELSRLSSDPSQASQRNVVLEQGKQLASQFNFVGNRLAGLQSSTRQQLEAEVKLLNQKMVELADVQDQIRVVRSHSNPNQLLDKRDSIINEIAEIIDVDRNELTQDGFGVTIAGGSISLGARPMKLSLVEGTGGELRLHVDDLGRGIVPQSGRLASLLNMHNETVPEFRSRLDSLAAGLMRNVDQAHAKGIGSSGAFSVLSSTRPVSDVNAPLATAGLPFPIKNGQLFITMTDPTGNLKTIPVAIDPATQSLTDVANAISGIDNLTAVVDPQTRQLKISAAQGYRFDFTGRMETVPDISGLTGTSTPRFGGNYNGVENGRFDVQIIGSGTIGQTPGLKAAVFDAGGRLVAELNVGEGYEAGRALNLVDGVSLAFQPGTVVDGETFSTPLVADSDTSGMLAALGINSFFSGDKAGNMAVNNEVLANPTRLAVSRTGDVSDASNLKRMVALQNALMVDGEASFEQFLGGMTSEIGAAVRATKGLQEQFQNLQYQYEADRDAVSGVDLNEEMINLTKFQRSYEASLRVISTIDQMYQEVLQILR